MPFQPVSDRRRGIINPIPKNAISDLRVPLNFKGTSLLSVVSKLYTGLLSCRIGDLLETNNLLANDRMDSSPTDPVTYLPDVFYSVSEKVVAWQHLILLYISRRSSIMLLLL